jgi:hypothetical protein
MSLLNAFHFDAGAVPPELVVVQISGGNVAPSTTVKRTGGYSLRINSYPSSDSNYITYSLPAAKAEIKLQFAFCYIESGTIQNSNIFRWLSGSTTLGGIKLNATSRKLEIYTGNFATLVATSNTAFTAGTIYVIELHIVIGDSGTITLRVDLNEDVTFSGDTKPGADTTITSLRMANIYSNQLTAYIYLDDIISHDTEGTFNNSWPNGAKVYFMVPTGDGAMKEWTPSAGTDHYVLVDEVPPSATDNLQATAIDKVDILTFPDLPGGAQSIRAVIPEVYAFKGSSTEPTRLAVGIDIGGEGVEYSADKDLALSQGIIRNVWEERPGGGVFSVEDISNLSLYLKSAA